MKSMMRVWALIMSCLVITPHAVQAADKAELQALVDKARTTIQHFKADPDMGWAKDNIRNAKGVLIVPRLLKGGFIIGGSGGSGVLLSLDQKSKRWSHPAFYTMGSLSYGLQVGGEASEILLMVMTNKGMESMLSGSLKLGGDVSIAAGPVGAGAKAATSDVLAFSRAKGAYGGLSVEGAVIDPRDSWNEQYYRKSVLPSDILVKRSVQNPSADQLVAELANITKSRN